MHAATVQTAGRVGEGVERFGGGVAYKRILSVLQVGDQRGLLNPEKVNKYISCILNNKRGIKPLQTSSA